MNAIFGAAINRHRASIGLPEVENVRDHVFTGRPWLASDAVLSPWHPTDLRAVVQTGAWLLPDVRPLPEDLEAYLDAGAAPVYVGFGSVPTQPSYDAAAVAIEAARSTGHRVLLSQGWAGLAAAEDADDCLVIGEVNQQSLFTRVAAAVHHGGAGTTTTAARAGVPQVVVPQIGDQPYWARRVAELGIGATPGTATPSAEALAASIRSALAPATRSRAAEVAR